MIKQKEFKLSQLTILFNMLQSLKQYKFHFRSLLVFITSIACYYSVCIHLFLDVSPHWIWSLYLSPIFVICVFLFCLFYISITNQHQAQSDGEGDFCITVILLTVMLIWWPIFIIIYLQMFEDVLIPFQSQSSQLISKSSYQYYNEQYTQLQFSIDDDEIALGCLSNQNQASVVDYPLPYKYYDLENEIIKLPSWFCGSQDQVISSQVYVSSDYQINNKKIVTFDYPNYISESFWIAFMTTIFQFACTFSSILIMAILLIIDQKPIESNIRKPSRKRRILAFILSYALYIFMISCNNLIITLTSLCVGFLFLIWSGFNKIHQHFCQMIKGMFKMVTKKIQYIPIVFIAVLLITIYLIFILIASQCVFHFKIFLCRHFVALWKGQNEEILEGYDEFINKLTALTWIWDILLIILLVTLKISYVLMIITLIFCVIQLCHIPYLLLVTKKQNFFNQQWSIYYTNYKIINQQCTENEPNQNPMELRDIELQMQFDKGLK